jgi:uncharacterized protein YgiM (DUF1202 family)
MKRLRRSKRIMAPALAAVLAAGAVAVVAEEVVVQRQKVVVREGASIDYDPVETVSKDVKLQVLGRSPNGWLHVQMPDGKQGYVFEKSLSGASSDTTLGPVSGNAVAASPENLAAGKGVLEPEAQQYASAKTYNTASLNAVIAANQAANVRGKSFDQFCKAGNVGPYKSGGH